MGQMRRRERDNLTSASRAGGGGGAEHGANHVHHTKHVLVTQTNVTSMTCKIGWGEGLVGAIGAERQGKRRGRSTSLSEWIK